MWNDYLEGIIRTVVYTLIMGISNVALLTYDYEEGIYT